MNVNRRYNAILKVGEQKKQYCGLTATIIKYNSYKNIDVVFSNGNVREGITYGNFSMGCIGPSKDKKYQHNALIESDRIGMSKQMKCGDVAKIIVYKKASDISVLFSDGTVIEHKTMSLFNKGYIGNPNIPHKRVGESRKMRCGMNATITDYKTRDNIVVTFEDGEVVRSTYDKFKNETIQNPNLPVPRQISTNCRKDRVGETRVMRCGLKATIKEYYNSDNITVVFENGTERTNKSYYNFLYGDISPIPKDFSVEDHFGEVETMNCGLRAVIIRFSNTLDLDVAFENGEIRNNCTYQNFKKGNIKPLSLHLNRIMSEKINIKNDKYKERIGETLMQNCGQEATIIDYRNSMSLDVEFPDGSKVYNRRYDDFKRGRIKSPNVPHHKFKDRTGETRIMNCGLRATIIRYSGIQDIDVEFETGEVKEHIWYGNFLKGALQPQTI